MTMRKVIFTIIFSLFCITFLNANEITLEVQNIKINNGPICVNIYYNERNYLDKSPNNSFRLDPINSIVTENIHVPMGECLIAVFQDSNNNGKLDTGLFGIPRELIGMTNYSGGIPGNYSKLKMTIDDTVTNIIIALIKF
jgi:uncharacterized protein (DUF2141 family)